MVVLDMGLHGSGNLVPYSRAMAVGEREVSRASAERRAAAQPSIARTRPRDPRIRVAVAGATGYAGGEVVRLLANHPDVELVGLTGRGREGDPVESVHPHLRGTGLRLESELPEADAYFLALPHGVAAGLAPSLTSSGAAVIDLGPDFRLHDPDAYPRWYGFDHPARELLARAVYGLPELHRDALMALADQTGALVASPGCYPTASLLAVAPLARAGLIAELIVDAKSGVSGAGREAKPDMMFSEANESVRAYGVDGHRHLPEIEQEVAAASAGASGGAKPDAQPVTFVPHLVPMTRGILATAYVRTTRPVQSDELDRLYADAYASEPFVRIVANPPATKHVLGSNLCHVNARVDGRTGRVIALAVIDNLVKGAAGQAIQAFNLVHGLPETAGLEQLPIAP
jgi:N-acetyl-gamma-glutamyl-phosphate reductase